MFLVGCASQEVTMPKTKEKIEVKETTKPIETKETAKKPTETTSTPTEITTKATEETKKTETLTKETTTPKNPNLIGHWKFDGNAQDSTSSYHGTIKGGAAFQIGKVGQAISLDGVDDYIELPASAVTKIGSLTQGTIAFWFQYTSLLDKQTVMPLFYIGVGEKDPDHMFIIEIGHFKDTFSGAGFPQEGAHPGPMNNPDPTNKKLYVTWVKDNKDPFLCYDSNVNLKENTWYHFAAVVSPEGNTGYLNGVEMGNRHYNFGKSGDPYFLDDIQNKKKLMVGRGRSVHTFSPDFVYHKGALDDFRIYDNALSGEEIKKLVG